MYNTTLDAPDSEPSHRKGLPRGHMVSAFKADKKTFLHLTVPRELTGHDAHYDLNTKRNGGCCPDLQLLKGETPSKPLTQWWSEVYHWFRLHWGTNRSSFCNGEETVCKRGKRPELLISVSPSPFVGGSAWRNEVLQQALVWSAHRWWEGQGPNTYLK